MKASELLKIHQSKRADLANTEILGDALLLESNSLYRNIKRTAIGAGARYVEAWPEYLLLPFHQLDSIVRDKKIPFVPSGRLLAEIESARPNVFEVEDLNLPESYHLHEAAHVVAEECTKNVKAGSRQDEILKAILNESFANAADALVWIFVDSDLHEFFLAQNCYMHPTKPTIQIMSRLKKSFGMKMTALLTIMCYVHANFLRDGMDQKSIIKLIEINAPGTDISEKSLKDCAALMEMCEKLDPLFRVRTTELYFKLRGIEGDIHQLLNFSFMDVFWQNANFQAALGALSDVLSG